MLRRASAWQREQPQPGVSFRWPDVDCTRGQSLTARLCDGATLGAQQALNVLLPVLNTLSSAHATGVVHGSVTPEFVWLEQSAAGVLKASLLPPTVDRAHASCVQTAFADDVADCGALLALALCGRDAVQPRAERESVPRFQHQLLRDTHALVFLPVIARALEFDPAARYRDATLMLRALRAAAEGSQLTALDSTSKPHEPSSAGRTRTEPAEPAAHAKADLVVGLDCSFLGPFELVRWLGSGSTGAVYEAYHPSSRQSLAVKLLQCRNSSAMSSFKREFRTLSEIDHPNLIAMHELFVDEAERGFFTMDLIAGVDFSEFVRTGAGQLDVARLEHCLEQLTRGLECLHAHGKLHRDLKPSNVLIDAQGHLTIIDFGLVQALDPEPDTRARRRSFEGTPTYAAPEQYAELDATVASDWYAVGSMLYEALCGVRPFTGDVHELMQAKRTRDPLVPSQLTASTVPAHLEDLCMELLTRDPNQRANGRDVLAALAKPPEPTRVEPPVACFGREGELAFLRASFECSRAGNLRATCIRGPSGMGKTLLARHFIAQLRRDGAIVLNGRCFVQEVLNHNAFDALMDELAQLIHSLPAELRASCVPRDVDLLGRMFPALRSFAPEPSAGCDSERIDSHRVPVALETGLQRRALAALRELLSHLALHRPIGLFIDDLQWSDADSVRLLHELLTRDGAPIWILTTYRTDTQPSTAALAELLQDAAGAGLANQLELGPIGTPAVVQMALALLGGDARGQAENIAQKSGGHPLFASELVRHAQASGHLAGLQPVELDAAFERRLSVLSVHAREMLELLCVAGHPLPRSLLFDAIPSARMSTLRELRFAGMIRDSAVAFDVYLEPQHDRLRDCVVERLPAARHESLHGVLAEHLITRGDSHLEQVVRHCVLAGRKHEAATLAERAAERASRRYAFHTAADLLKVALDHATAAAEAQRLRLMTANACSRAGRTLLAAQGFERAAHTAPVEQQMSLRLTAADLYFVSGRRENGLELLAPLAAGLGMPLEAGQISMLRLIISLLLVLVTGAPRLRKRPASPSAAEDSARESLRRMWRFTPALLVVDPELACRVASHALAIAARRGDRCVYGQALSFHVTMFAIAVGRPLPMLRRSFARATRLVAPEGDIWESALVQVMEGCAALVVSNSKHAVELTLDIACTPELPTPFAASVRSCARGVALPGLYWTGRIAQLVELAEIWGDDAYVCGDRHLEVSCKVIGAQGYLRSGDSARARANIENARGISLDYLHTAYLDPWWEANVAMYEGNVQAALEICEHMRFGFRLRSGRGAPTRVMWHLTEGTCAAAAAASGSGSTRDAALARLARSARAARRSYAHGGVAIAAQLAGTLAFQLGKRRSSIEYLERAIAAYDATGMRLHAASLRLSLARLGPRHHAHEHAALAVFAEEGIEHPERWAYMRAPGLAIELG